MSEISAYSDRDLLAAIRNDDEAAFTELVRRYWKKLHLNAMARMNDENEAEEIVQEVFLSLWDKRHSRLIENLSSYLYVCVKNRSLNLIAAKINERKYWDYYKNFLSDEHIVRHEPIDYSSLVEHLDNSLLQLPPKSQLVFKMSRLEGRSVSEIAKALNLSEKAIEYHLTQSLKKLRIYLKDYILGLIVVFL